MRVFVSWSGDRSRQIAEAIRGWLPKVVQSVKPWMSAEDIGAGARWLSEVSTTLNAATVGLICVTPENQHNPWLLFEAGALSKTLEQTCVCPLVFEMTPGQLKGPLTQFQANSLDRNGIGKVLFTINKSLGDGRIDPQQLEEILDVWWPKLDEKLKAISPSSAPTVARSTNDQLEELLLLARENMRRENLRLEASMDRDEKFDSLLGFMDQAGAMIGVTQTHGQRMQSSLSQRSCHAIPTGGGAEMLGDLGDDAKAMAKSTSQAPLNTSPIIELAGTLREMQERDKIRTASMLTPPSPASAVK